MPSRRHADRRRAPIAGAAPVHFKASEMRPSETGRPRYHAGADPEPRHSATRKGHESRGQEGINLLFRDDNVQE
jgi:hypothetical protein